MSNIDEVIVSKYIRCEVRRQARWFDIISQTAWHFALANGLKFSHDDHNKDNNWIFNINEFAYQTQTKQYNDQSHLVSVEHGFVVNKTHTSIKKLIIQMDSISILIIHRV